jgi:hypothetical protein
MHRQVHQNPSAVLAVSSVGKFKLAAMFFHHTRDDREAEPRPLSARGHVGFQQPPTIMDGEANAIIDDFDPSHLFLQVKADLDLTDEIGFIACPTGCNPLTRIF